jgi:hypothetical protein
MVPDGGPLQRPIFPAATPGTRRAARLFHLVNGLLVVRRHLRPVNGEVIMA